MKTTQNCIFTILVICTCFAVNLVEGNTVNKNGLRKSLNESVVKQAMTDEKLVEISMTYLKNKSRPRLGIKRNGNNVNEVKVTKILKDDLTGSRHVKLEETINGVPIFGENIIVNLNANGEVYKYSEDHNEREVLIDTVPKITIQQAQECLFQKKNNVWIKRNFQYNSNQLVIYPKTKDIDILAYQIQVDITDDKLPEYPIVFVDAATCLVVGEIDNLQGADTYVYDSKSSFHRGANLSRSPATAPSSDKIVEECYQNANKVDKFLNEFFRRNSWNDKGEAYRINVHYMQSSTQSFWHSPYMTFGDGLGTWYSSCLDITMVAHEIGHSIIEVDSGLIYKGESGALNDSFADIFAVAAKWYFNNKTVDADTYKIGQNIFKQPGHTALRHMHEPSISNKMYAECYKNYEELRKVHFNSGIGNKAFHLAVTGGRWARCTSNATRGIGFEKVIKIVWRAQQLYYNKGTTFNQAKDAWVQAAKDLYGDEEIRSVNNAWAAVGVGKAM